MTTILKDGELNFDFNVWFMGKKSQIRIFFIFFFIILLNGRVGKYFTNIEYLFAYVFSGQLIAGKCELMPIKCEINNVFCNYSKTSLSGTLTKSNTSLSGTLLAGLEIFSIIL